MNKLHDSTDKGSGGKRKHGGRISHDKKNVYDRSVNLRNLGHVLGYSNPIAAGDAIRNAIVKKAEHEAQHGPVRVLVKDGKPVPQE